MTKNIQSRKHIAIISIALIFCLIIYKALLAKRIESGPSGRMVVYVLKDEHLSCAEQKYWYPDFAVPFAEIAKYKSIPAEDAESHGYHKPPTIDTRVIRDSLFVSMLVGEGNPYWYHTREQIGLREQ